MEFEIIIETESEGEEYTKGSEGEEETKDEISDEEPFEIPTSEKNQPIIITTPEFTLVAGNGTGVVIKSPRLRREFHCRRKYNRDVVRADYRVVSVVLDSLSVTAAW